MEWGRRQRHSGIGSPCPSRRKTDAMSVRSRDIMRRSIALVLALSTLAFPGCFAPPANEDFEPKLIADFSLTERNNETITREDLLGKVWVAAFVFTRCPRCTQISGTMARLQHELSDHADVRLV